jgi:hypothetical protein
MLKKLIRESFFNPVLHIFPILLFLFLAEVFQPGIAWIMSLPVAAIILLYVFIFYRSLYKWYIISFAIFLIVGFVATLLNSSFGLWPFNKVAGQVVAVLIMLILLVFRKKVRNIVLSVTSKKVSMQNNLNELIRLAKIFIVILSGYALGFLAISFFNPPNAPAMYRFVFQLYIALLLVVILYEYIRVTIIRVRLLKEDWLPIVNDRGREIGSINYQTSMWTEEDKFTHPVVRVMIIEGNKVFLRQHHAKAGDEALKWDTAISSHMRLGEDVQDCVKRISPELYGIKDLRPVFMGNYLMENSCEFQYVHLMLTCRVKDIQPNLKHMHHVKWWTIQQIFDNLSEGIFTQNFLKEFDILQRSGLIDTGRCSCDCKLRDEVDKKK